MKTMRAKIVEGLNTLLDEDHNSVERVFMSAVRLSDSDPYAQHKCAVRVDCVSYMSGLDLLGILCDTKPVIAVYEDGLIRRFE